MKYYYQLSIYSLLGEDEYIVNASYKTINSIYNKYPHLISEIEQHKDCKDWWISNTESYNGLVVQLVKKPYVTLNNKTYNIGTEIEFED